MIGAAVSERPEGTNPGFEPDRRLGFLIAGVQKGGTTSLHNLLSQHPQIARSSSKELHFFDDEKQDWSNPNYRRYHRWITWHESATIAGESTPIYIFWPDAMERIKAYNPGMRLVLSFRDPIERAFSQWCMVKNREADCPDFSTAIRVACPTRWPRTKEEITPRSRAFVARGYYGEQLAHVYELFPADQVLRLDYHRLFVDLRDSLDRITDFVGVDRFTELPAEVRRRTQPEALDGSPPTEADVELLVDRYRADLQAFSALSGIDVSTWPTAQVASGSLPAADLAAALAAKVRFTTPEEAARRRRRAEAKARRKSARRTTATGRVDAPLARAPQA